MNENVWARFSAELNGYFLLVVINLVFASLAVATGVQYMVWSTIHGTGGVEAGVPGMAMAMLSMICFGLGISWVITCARILSGITEIRNECRKYEGEVTPEVLTSWIIRTIAHYRENRKQVNTMRYVCLLGGFCFLGLGLLGGIQSLSAGPASISITLDSLRVIPLALLALIIALISLMSSLRFGNFKKSWDGRLEDIGRYEEELEVNMGMNQG